MQNRDPDPSLRPFDPGSIFRSILKFVISQAAPCATAMALPALVAFFCWSSADAQVVVTTVTGTLTGSSVAGTTTDGVSRSLFGLAPGTSLSGQAFTLTYTTTALYGTSSSNAPTSSYIENSGTNPIVATMTVNNQSINRAAGNRPQQPVLRL